MDDPLRRRFVAIATDIFDAFPALEVSVELADLEAWLCDPSLEARRFTREFERLARGPSRDAIVEDLRTLGGAEAVVIYITGHGAVDAGRHQIVLRGSDPDDLTTTAYATADLITLLARRPALDHVLLIIDLCEAGDLGEELERAIRPLIPRSWIVLLATAAGADAKVGALSGTVREVIASIRDGVDLEITELEPYLRSHEFIARVKRLLWENHRQELRPAMDPYGPSFCLPNPRFQADRVPTSWARRDLAVLQEDMAAHWRRRAPVEGTPFLFAGRSLVMERLISFCAGPVGALVVTGGAGSGKSAVLARLVTCSDPAFREAYGGVLERALPVPPPDAVDIAVLATGKSPLQVAAQIGAAVGVVGSSVEEWIDAIAASVVQPLTLVVDAVDESSDPLALIRSVLQPLLGSLRLLVGVRSTGHERDYAGLAIEALDAPAVSVDADAFWDPSDLRRLLAESVSTELAARIEAGAGRSFLLALLVASRAEEGADVDALLAGGVAEVVRQELAGRDDLIAFLRATALAFGRGLPWRDIWPAVATAIAPSGVTVDVAALLQDRAAGYLVRDLEDGITVYRPFHDALRESLAQDAEPGHPPFEEAHARIAEVLLTHLPAPYARRHLPEHAAAAGHLDERYVNRTSLPYLDAASLSRTLRLVEAEPGSTFGVLLGAWRGIRHRWAFEDPERNAAALDFVLASADVVQRVAHGRQLTLDFDGVSDPVAMDVDDGRDVPATRWNTLWARWSSGGTVLGRAVPGIPQIAFGVIAGRACLAIADTTSAQLWDAATNEPLGPAIAVENAYAVAIADELLVVRDHSGLGAYDALTGRRHWHSDQIRHAGPLVANSETVAAAAGESIHVLELGTGQPRCAPLVHEVDVTALAASQDELFASLRDGRILAWSLATLHPREKTLLAPGHVDSLATLTMGAVTVTVAGYAHGYLVATGDQERLIVRDRGGVGAIALAFFNDGPYLAAAAGTSANVNWLLATQSLKLPHPSLVDGVAFGLVDGQPILATAATDGAVRLWDPMAQSDTGAATRTFRRLAFGGGLLSGIADGRPTAVDPLTGTQAIQTGRRRLRIGSAPAVGVGLVEGRMVMATADVTRTEAWAYHDRLAEHEWAESEPSRHAIAFVGSHVLVARALVDRHVEVWDLLRQERLYTIESAVKLVDFDGAALVVRGTDGIRIYAALDGQPLSPHIERPWNTSVALAGREAVLATETHIERLCLETGRWFAPAIESAGRKTGVALVEVGGEKLIVSGHQRTVRAWSAETGRLVTQLPLGTRIESTLGWNQDGRAFIAVAGPGIAVVELRPA